MDMRPCDASFAHLALNVPDLEQVQKRAERYGARPLGKIGTVDTGPNKGKRLMYIQTWDGVTVEIMGGGAVTLMVPNIGRGEFAFAAY